MMDEDNGMNLQEGLPRIQLRQKIEPIEKLFSCFVEMAGEGESHSGL
jgi:hypothetical protein